MWAVGRFHLSAPLSEGSSQLTGEKGKRALLSGLGARVALLFCGSRVAVLAARSRKKMYNLIGEPAVGVAKVVR